MLGLGVLIFAAVMTRYDGWMLGATGLVRDRMDAVEEPGCVREACAGVFVGVHVDCWRSRVR